MKKLRCVGYVKPMDCMNVLSEEKRIPAVDVEVQKTHIHSYAEKNGFLLDKMYIENTADECGIFLQLREDAIHRKFDVLILDSLFCFGTTIHAAADFIENVMPPAGFRVITLDAGETNLTEYIHACCERFRIAQSQIKYYEKGEIPHRGSYDSRVGRKNTTKHDLPWYESRQKEIFQEMLSFDERFEKLEAELKECRAMIKKLRS